MSIHSEVKAGNVNFGGKSEAEVMTDWKTFWNDYPASAGEQDFLVQVGHTEGGQPYSQQQFDVMLGSIRTALGLAPGDRLLDVCCGNGIVTSALAQSCSLAVGADFSETLIGVARRHNAAPNVSYVIADARDLQTLDLASRHFNRILLYAALQHFETGDLPRLLSGLSTHAEDGAVILIGGILDASRKHLYLDTPEKISQYERYGNEGRDRLGTWWEPALLRDTCKAFGFGCDIDQATPARPGAQFRFDARITA